ncbi:MAG TPA: BON domain-containing protein [Bryobacteraceae bacterium]|nr:BON domain-containing protein [Bryobacteraceae bacterium]
MKIHNIAVAVVLAVSPSLMGYGQESTEKPDNTKANQRDRETGGATADQQKNNSTDRELTRSIRRAITRDKSLSTYAHNVKIISQNGTVTLKGPVRSEEERKTIIAKAVTVVGSPDRVNDQMAVKP